jgi:hypothetical protein
MSDLSELKCTVPGCGCQVPAELEAETLCVPHFLRTAEKGCSDMRRETAGQTDSLRRAAIQNYVATTAVKLACIGTGNLRLSDEMKKRILTDFHSLMILRENLDRPSLNIQREVEFLPRTVLPFRLQSVVR